MAVFSTILCSDLNSTKRIEAEYFKPEYLKIEKNLSRIGAEKITQYSCKITDGTHFTPTYKTSGVKFFSALNVKENIFAQDDKHKFISQDEHNLLYSRCNPEPNDVLIRKVGVGPRWACVIPESGINEFSLFVSVALIKLKKKSINPHYLSTFINSKYGQLQLLRIQKGASQPDLHLEDIAELKIPRFSNKNEYKIAELIEAGIAKLDQFNTFIFQAQQMLEAKLGLDTLKLDKPVGYEANFNELINSHRLDAQHFKPEYKALLKHIQKGNWTSLRNLRIYSRRGVQPLYVEDGEIPVVNSQHIGKRHLDYDNLQKTTVSLFKASPEAHIQPDDLLIYTTGAYIGATNVYLSDQQALASNHVNILRLNGSVDPAYMALVLQSKIGQFQTKKHARGSAQAELYPSDIDKFIVPLLPNSKANEIGNLVRASLRKKQESEQLLEKAKHRVEQLIEEAVEQ